MVEKTVLFSAHELWHIFGWNFQQRFNTALVSVQDFGGDWDRHPDSKPDFRISYHSEIEQKSCEHNNSWTAALRLIQFYTNI